MITRTEYMADKSPDAFHKYYSQFTTPSVQRLVASVIGVDRIKRSTDPDFNDIPLQEWDNLQGYILSCVGSSLAKANGSGGISLSDCVCVAKTAARIIKGVGDTIEIPDELLGE
jgi:hypothetical protein